MKPQANKQGLKSRSQAPNVCCRWISGLLKPFVKRLHLVCAAEGYHWARQRCSHASRFHLRLPTSWEMLFATIQIRLPEDTLSSENITLSINLHFICGRIIPGGVFKNGALRHGLSNCLRFTQPGLQGISAAPPTHVPLAQSTPQCCHRFRRKQVRALWS